MGDIVKSLGINIETPTQLVHAGVPDISELMVLDVVVEYDSAANMFTNMSIMIVGSKKLVLNQNLAVPSYGCVIQRSLSSQGKALYKVSSNIIVRAFHGNKYSIDCLQALNTHWGIMLSVPVDMHTPLYICQ